MEATETISVTMPTDLLSAVRDAVDAGDYASTSEVLRDALRVWQGQRHADADRHAAIRGRIHRSLADPRPDVDEKEADEYFARLHEDTVKAGHGEKV